MADYVLEGPKWGDGGLGTGGGTVTWSIGASVPNSFKSDIVQAFAEWSKQANIQFQQVASNGNIGFSVNPIDGPSKTLGYAEYSYSGTRMLSAEVTFDSGEGWQLRGSTVVSSSGIELFPVALHEIGHAIGLGHYDASPAVMNAIIDRSIDDLVDSDIAGVRALYGSANLPLTSASTNGDDRIVQDGAASSGLTGSSVTNILGLAGNDSIVLANAANKAAIFVGGGAGLDTITVVNAGATTIFGGVDSTDGADRITFNGVAGAAGSSLIYGNGGDDIIAVGNTSALDSTSAATVFGGFGNDQITMNGTKAALNALGGEGADTITVTNAGFTFITGGVQSGDQSLDGADRIIVNGSGGTVAIFANLGNDSVSATELQDGTTIQIYGGKGGDTLVQGNAGAGDKNSIFIAGGEDGDTITAASNGGALTIFGGTSASDSTDGADAITLGQSTGTINVFANAGNDTVVVGSLGTDAANTARIYGGSGSDVFQIAGQSSTAQALVVSGNQGADTFSIAKGAGQSITIDDLSIGDGDKLVLTALGGTPGGLQITVAGDQTLQSALDAASTASGGSAGQSKAAAVVFGGSTYVVIEQGGVGFQAGTDQAIKLTGVTDLEALRNVATLVA